MSISRKYFDKTARGEEVTQYTLTNHKGASGSVIDFGGIVTSIVVPDRDGKLADVNLGFDVVDTYDGKGGCMGALIGRVGNRIGGAAFDLEGHHYVLGKNDGDYIEVTSGLEEGDIVLIANQSSNMMDMMMGM